MNKSQKAAHSAILVAETLPQPHTQEIAVQLFLVKTKLSEYNRRAEKLGAQWAAQDLRAATRLLLRAINS